MLLCHLWWAAFSLFVSVAVRGHTSALYRRVDRTIALYNLIFTFRLIHLYLVCVQWYLLACVAGPAVGRPMLSTCRQRLHSAASRSQPIDCSSVDNLLKPPVTGWLWLPSSVVLLGIPLYANVIAYAIAYFAKIRISHILPHIMAFSKFRIFIYAFRIFIYA